MALYLGSSEKMKVNLDFNTYCFRLLSKTPVVKVGVRLLSLDDYILQDSEGIYLTVEEVE